MSEKIYVAVKTDNDATEGVRTTLSLETAKKWLYDYKEEKEDDGYEVEIRQNVYDRDLELNVMEATLQGEDAKLTIFETETE